MYEELKKAAEACKDLLPLRYMESHGSLYIRNDCGIVFDVHQNRSFPDFMAHNKAYADLALAANPSAVLALIAAHAMEKGSVDEWQGLAARRATRMTELMNEVDRLKAENEVARMRIKELDLLFGRYILAMRAAVIEENAEKGMEWIYNSLAGPGELPPEDETDAQAYFDREIIDVEKGMDEVLAFHDARRKAKEAAK